MKAAGSWDKDGRRFQPTVCEISQSQVGVRQRIAAT
jgi:hypothetical protein